MNKSRKVGPFRVRLHIRNGMPTGKWFVDIPATLTSNGQRKRKLFDNQRTALEVARELKRRIDPVSGQLVPKTRTSGLSFCKALELWHADELLRVKTLKKRASTLKIDLYRCRSLTAFFGEDDIASLTERRLTEYQSWRLDQGRQPQTINSELGTFSLVMGWAQKQGYLSEVPKTEQIPVRRRHVVIPTPEEVVRIIGALPPRLQPLVRFLAETGCRKGEAINLTWDCVDEVGGYVEIRSREGWTPKTQQSERRIPLNLSLLALIRDLPKKGPYVFAGEMPDRPMANFRKAWKTAVGKADIRRRGEQVHIPPKALRKAHATWQAERGVHESVLQGLLGHAMGSRVTKQYYVQVTEEAKRKAVIKLPIPERNGNKNGQDLAKSGNKSKKERHSL